MPKARLDIDEIVRLYLDEKQDVRQIATRFGCSYSRVYGILRSREVLRKSRRWSREYVKVAQIMRERIIAGDWPPGHKILAKPELAKIFDVSLQTIREAVADLRERGYLCTVPDKGTYVSPPRIWEPGGRAAETISTVVGEPTVTGPRE